MKRRPTLVIAMALAAVCLLGAGSASAQEHKEFSLQKFLPSIHSLSGFTVESARVSHELTINAFAMFNYAGPLLQDANDEDVVDSFGTADLVASIGIIDRLSFGFNVPIHVGASGTFLDGDDVATAGIGDIRLSLKAAALKPFRIGGGIAFQLDLAVPSGSKGGYGREEGVVVMPKILLDAVTKHVHLMTNLFFVSRTADFEVARQSDAIDFDDDFEISAEAGASAAAAIFLGSTDFRMLLEGRFQSRLKRWFEAENTQLEFTWGLHWKHRTGFAIGGGASFGVLNGYGDPDWRAFFSVGYQPGKWIPVPDEVIEADRDGDGIVDNVDQCPDDPEDMDDFEDLDGCPDNDNDSDGIPDRADKCPNEPEDADGDRDDDGCPDGDADGDGIGDDFDQCPKKAEDKDGFEDRDGCPDPDNDGDGILDRSDKCPDRAEDFDGDRDQDGCPDGDGDKDGIADDVDKCPTQP